MILILTYKILRPKEIQAFTHKQSLVFGFISSTIVPEYKYVIQ